MLAESLYKKHKDELERFARSMARNEKEAEDLLQDTFLKVLTHQQTLKKLAYYQQRAWLFKVLRNLYYDRYRKRQFEVLMNEQIERENHLGLHSDIEMKELLQSLPDRQRTIVYQRYFLGLTSKQIAGPLGLSDATVRYHLQTALELLRNNFNE